MSKRKYELYLCPFDHEWAIARRIKGMAPVCSNGHAMSRVAKNAMIAVQQPHTVIAGELFYAETGVQDVYDLLINLGPADEPADENNMRRWNYRLRACLTEGQPNHIAVEADPGVFGEGHLLANLEMTLITGQLTLYPREDTPCDISQVVIQKVESLDGPPVAAPPAEPRIFTIHMLPTESESSEPEPEPEAEAEGTPS